MDYLLDLVIFAAKLAIFFVALIVLIGAVVKILVNSMRAAGLMKTDDQSLILTIEDLKARAENESSLFTKNILNPVESIMIEQHSEHEEKSKNKMMKAQMKAQMKLFKENHKAKSANADNSSKQTAENKSETSSEINSTVSESSEKNKEDDETIINKSVMVVYDFNGSIDADEVRMLRRVIDLMTNNTTEGDELVIRLTSPGGTVNGYGLCASELERLKAKKIKLTVAVDEVAASGGYLMGCTADHIIAAPFSYIGSIGVVTEFPNFNRILKKYDIDYEQVTAGEFKRTMTQFNENTDEARAHVKEELTRIHDAFKAHVKKNRPGVDIEKIANGEHWLASEAIGLGLVDELKTSDEYIQENLNKFDAVLRVSFNEKKRHTLVDKLPGRNMLDALGRLVLRVSRGLKAH